MRFHAEIIRENQARSITSSAKKRSKCVLVRNLLEIDRETTNKIMKEKAKSQKTGKTNKNATGSGAKKPVTPRTSKAATKSVPVAQATEPKKATKKEPAAKKNTRISRPKLTPNPLASSPETVTPSWSMAEIQQVAFFKWCERRNEGLPDDPMADWIAAESELGLAN
jgi:hypothetical protein